MGQDRRDYRYDTMYIEAIRILNPQFDSVVIELTGAQVELLRNATMLFNSQDMFVDAYHDGYYINASDADYDEILAIVADLENKLMGGKTMLWGYDDTYREEQYDLDADTSTITLTFGLVPANEIWVITQWIAVNEDTRTTNNTLLIALPASYFDVASVHPDAANHRTGTSVFVVLKTGERVEMRIEGCQQDDVIRGWVSGYKIDANT